jgi:hypothetical protein
MREAKMREATMREATMREDKTGSAKQASRNGRRFIEAPVHQAFGFRV